MLYATIIENVAGIVASNALRYDTAGDREIALRKGQTAQRRPYGWRTMLYATIIEGIAGIVASNALRYGLPGKMPIAYCLLPIAYCLIPARPGYRG